MVREPRPLRAAAGAGCAAAIRRGAGARALWRDQPRHRAARPRRPGAGQRAPADARAVHGRCVSVPGEIRLRHRGKGRGRPSELVDRIVFSLHPHQTRFNLPAAAAFPVPPDVPPLRAVLAANMETALNAVWDGAPGPADRIAVVGGGVVGLLVAYLCARLPRAQVTRGRYRAARAAARPRDGSRFRRRR